MWPSSAFHVSENSRRFFGGKTSTEGNWSVIHQKPAANKHQMWRHFQVRGFKFKHLLSLFNVVSNMQTSSNPIKYSLTLWTVWDFQVLRSELFSVQESKWCIGAFLSSESLIVRSENRLKLNHLHSRLSSHLHLWHRVTSAECWRQADGGFTDHKPPLINSSCLQLYSLSFKRFHLEFLVLFECRFKFFVHLWAMKQSVLTC